MIKNSVPFKSISRIYYSHDLIRLYVDASGNMTNSYILLYLILIPSMSFFIPFSYLLLWSCIALTHLILRQNITKQLTRALDANAQKVDKYMRWSICISVYGGALWGSLGWLNLLYFPHSYHYVSVAIILGVAAAAIATLSTVFISYVLFLFSMMFTQISAMFIIGEIDDFIVALMVIVYMVVIIPIARLFYLRTKESFALSATLQESKQELARLNETLEERVQEKTKALQYSYYHDYLTGLENLKKFAEVVNTENESYVILLDIREFGTLNKQYGKVISDKILVNVAELLKRQMRPNISLFRGENDRFVIYCESMSLAQTEDFTKQIISFFEMYMIEVGDIELQVTFKAGISNICEDEECLIHAEYALTMAKRKGVNTFTYDIAQEELQAEKDIIEWLSRTKSLVLNENIRPLFQPIYDIHQKQILKYECLARGMIDGKLIAPYNFLRAAERLDLIKNVTHIMIDKCFSFFEKNDYHFSINLTGSDLLDPNFIDFLDIKLKRYDLDPSRISFEILENITTYSSGNVLLESLHKIKLRGCKIAIDDFGVENSNFSRLLQIDIDYIKIDGLFIRNLLVSEKDKKIVQAIVGLAKTLGVKTIAEFVENKAIFELIKECGVDYAQGYFIGKPEEYLAENIDISSM